MSSISRVLCPALMVVLVAGCSSGSTTPKRNVTLVPAHGTLTYNGSPVEGATIIAQPLAGDHPGSCMTVAGGKFQLKAFAPEDGVPPGPYLIGVSKVTIGTAETTIVDGEVINKTPPPTYDIPQNFANPAATMIQILVPDKGSKELVIELKD